MSEAITCGEIKVSTFNLMSIKKLKIVACMNEHSTLYLVGMLSEEQGINDIYTDYQTPIEVSIELDKVSQNIFCGVITEVKIKETSNYFELHINAKSHTYLMDIKKRKRSFQNKELSDKDLIRNVVKGYQNGSCIVNFESTSMSNLIVQYQETDWELIKRITVSNSSGVFPYVLQSGVHFYVGVPQKECKSIDIIEYILVNHLEQYDNDSEYANSNGKKKEYLSYFIKSYEILELGDSVQLKQGKYYCRKLDYELEDGLLVNSYELEQLDSRIPPKRHSKTLKGLSLEGTVIDVSSTKVKVHLDIDREQNKESAYWFAFSTVAASPDGSGWYFMPEVNDRVRVYFPSNDEKDAYAISCIQEQEGNPDEKYIQNIYGKKVVFTKDSVIISANGGAAITLNSSGGVLISGSSVSINASKSITMRSEDTMNISAAESVTINCDQGGKLDLNSGGDIKINGCKVKIN